MQTKKHTIWLDCDPGLDDTFAIILAAHHKDIHLLGVSTSPGNTSLENTTHNALNVLYNIGRSDVPVFAGSNALIKGNMKLAQHMHGSNGLGGVIIPKSPVNANHENSFQKIYHRIKNYEGQVVWANTGSLTNLCILLLSFPEIKSKISQIVLMGGALGKGNITPAAQFNIYFDPCAYDQVLHIKGDIPLVMIPLEVTHQNIADQNVFDRFKVNDHIPFANACHTMLKQYQIMYYNNYKIPFPPIHDPCVIFYILHPEEFEASKVLIEVDTNPTSYGRTNCYFKNPSDPKMQLISKDLVTTHLKNQKTIFWDEMFKCLDEIFSASTQNNIKNEL